MAKHILVAFLGSAMFVPVFAFAQNETIPSFGDIIQKLPPPLSDFINSIRNADGEIIQGAPPPVDFQRFNPFTLFRNLDDWLREKTGLSVRQIVRAIGGLLVWVLELVASLIKWLLSFLG